MWKWLSKKIKLALFIGYKITFLSKALAMAWRSSLVFATSNPATILLGLAVILTPVDRSENISKH